MSNPLSVLPTSSSVSAPHISKDLVRDFGVDPQIIESIKSKLIEARNIALIPHKNPDGDTLGAALAMYWYLKGLSKQVMVVCSTGVPESLHYLPGVEEISNNFVPGDYDTFISFDTADPKLSGFLTDFPAIYNHHPQHINVDHHTSNHLFGGINLLVTQAASTTQVLFYLFEDFKAVISPEIATCLLTGLYTDTGSFMHQNTTAETLRVGGKLLSAGARLKEISYYNFLEKKVNQLKLWGRILDRTKLTEEGVIVSAVTQKDHKELNTNKDDLSGAIEFLKYVPGIKYAEILSEENGGRVKGSLRTIRDDVDVSEVASHYGGGGHIKAAGFTIPGELRQETQWTITSEGKKEIL